MPPPVSPAVRRRFARRKTRDTAPELAVRKLLHANGLRYRVDAVVLNRPRRRADVVFPRVRLAVFIDGCFWHGCPLHATWPKNNGPWWRDKLELNVARDHDTDERLTQAAWQVLRFWEHESPITVSEEIERCLRELRGSM